MRLNLGSGQRKFGPGWTNVDINPKWEPDVVADGASMPMFEDGSADLVVAHHTLEHYGCGEAAPMVRECHRVLKPGGSLLVFVPDMDALARMWIRGEMTTQVYLTNVYGAYMDDEADRHRWGYDRKSLTEFLLGAAPWMGVFPFDWRPIEGADIANANWVIGMEAFK